MTNLPIGEYAFPGPLRDQLVAAIVAGVKTSTSSLVAEYVDEPLPKVGDREIVVDSDNQHVCITTVTDVSVVRFADVPLSHALAEGEGFRTVADWAAAHRSFWQSREFQESLPRPIGITDHTEVVCVSFVASQVF
ncbi:MAG: ASCH domain-containing protein [Corynebacterium sp.]|uniref:ASCH domain-containing protein n=1 Tax=Corynebacterium sp. TaxID=1720 RepID=UPI0026DCEEEF|nr:ASCH domain-containing protein [Corynebacterium sp.]MDO5097510.1 ASCH domain-containing protein [Corynebacterium sp.]